LQLKQYRIFEKKSEKGDEKSIEEAKFPNKSKILFYCFSKTYILN